MPEENTFSSKHILSANFHSNSCVRETRSNIPIML